ncbi:MAG: hypothetical protein JW919_01830 [Candidatus Omnitrophica bacterium]|nr:hypothetical protein [Candidatus Omnitrophota bacterium]
MAKKTGKGRLITLITVLALLAGAWGGYYIYDKYLSWRLFPKYRFQKGMCYVTWNKDRWGAPGSDESLKEMAKAGVKWVAFIPTWYQEGCGSTRIFPTENTPTDESLAHAIKTAHRLGMKVMIKPHLDVLDMSGGNWRGEIICEREPEWAEWFADYQAFILHYAKIAQAKRVAIFCLGTELKLVSIRKPDMWREYVIEPVRRIYKGPLTYAAHWDEEFERVKFWDALDYIGIDAYFPLAKKSGAPYEEIRKGWDEWIGAIEAVQAKYGKPVLFPEIGYCSARGAAKKPWEDLASGELDLQVQADCYRALFERFWDKDWFYGAYWWRWGTDVRFGGPENKSYTPQGKPALDIMREWYSKPVPKKKFEKERQ